MKKLKIIIAVFIIAFQMASFAAEKPTVPAEEVQRLLHVIATIHHYYVKPIDNKKLFNSAIAGMLESLDPHSSYLSEKDIKNLKLITSGRFAGIGVKILPIKGVLKVISPIDDTPAQKAGLKSGDIIFRIDNKLTKKLSPNKALEMIRGKKGTKVKLFVIRKKETKPLKFVIVRDSIKIKTVRYKLYDHHYGYVRIALFNIPTRKEVITAIRELNKKSKGKLRGLIIDLRNNPGGMLIPSVEVTSLFLDADTMRNKLIVYTKGYPENRRRNFIARRGEILPKIPIVVLINEGSASAAEIMAGALQDHKRAIIIGAKSFGKGSVQSILPVDGKGALKLTTSLYYTPKGRSIQAEGIKPDVIVADLTIPKTKTDALLFSPIHESFLSNHFLNGTKKQASKTKKRNGKELLHKDYQLYEALNLVKGLSSLQKK